MFGRPGLPSFDYVRADTRDQVVDLLQEHGRAARLMMGGTDLLVRMRDGVERPALVVDVKHLPGMRAISADGQGVLEVGAAVSLNELASHSEVRSRYPLLVEAARSVASYQVRTRATLGGNLCNASPAADTAPAVLALDGRVVLYGPHGERELPAAEFFLGPGKTAMRPDEFMLAVRLPPPREGDAGAYLKLGRSRAGDLAIVGVAIYAAPEPAVASGYLFRIGLASVAPVPLRAWAAEALLAQRSPVNEVFEQAAAEAASASNPIDDVRASAAYRRQMVRALTLSGLRRVWTRMGEGFPR